MEKSSPTRTAATNDPVADLRKAEATLLLSGGWERAGLSEHWPLATGEAAELLCSGLHFDCGVDDLVDLVARRMLKRPAVEEDDEFSWNADDVIAAANLLEGRRQWLACPSVHDAKKNDCEIALEQFREQEKLAELIDQPGVPRWDLRHLMLILSGAASVELKQQVLALLRATLEIEHGVVV
jgi:hypothetical protein